MATAPETYDAMDSSDLPDQTPTPQKNSQLPGISPYHILAAKQEVASGKPGAAVAAIGAAALQSGAIHPVHAAQIAESTGHMPPGSAQTIAKNFIGPPAPPQMGPGGTVGTPQGVQPQPGSPNFVGPMQPQAGTPVISGIKPTFEKDTSSDESKESASNTTKQNIGTPDGLYAQKLAEVQAQNAPSQSALAQLQALAKQGRMPLTMQPDLSGLMMAADFLNKTNTFGKDYQAQRAGQIAEQENAQKQDQESFGNQAAALKEQLTNQEDEQKTALGLVGGGTVGSAGNLVNTQKQIQDMTSGNKNAAGEYDKWSAGVRGDKILNASLDASSKFSTASQMVNQNSNISTLMAKGDLLKAAFGRVNQAEYQQAGGDPGTENTVTRLWNKYNDYLKNNPTQDPSHAFTPLDQQEFRQAINTMAGQANKDIGTRTQLYRVDAQSRGLPTTVTEPVLGALHPTPPPNPAPVPTPHKAAGPVFAADVLAYAKKYGKTPAEALAIKQKRGG